MGLPIPWGNARTPQVLGKEVRGPHLFHEEAISCGFFLLLKYPALTHNFDLS